MPERVVQDSGEDGGKDSAPVETERMLAQRFRQCEAEMAELRRENARLRHALQASEQKSRHLVEQSLIGISLNDGRRFTYVNPKFAEITGYRVDELLEMGPLDIIPPDERAEAEAWIRRGLAGEVRENFIIRTSVQRKDGKRVSVELTGGLPVEVEGHRELISMLVDITERVRNEDEIHRLHLQLMEQATRDPLTDLYNRRYLEETLARELIRAERQGEPLSLVMGDMDGFKEINDSRGHRFGDDALRVFGRLIQQYCRRSDVPCRYGGDEFLLILPGMDQQKACERAEILRRQIADKPMLIGDARVDISASFGVATYPVHARDADGLIAAADRSLYRAKAAGRNRVCGCDGEGEGEG